MLEGLEHPAQASAKSNTTNKGGGLDLDALYGLGPTTEQTSQAKHGSQQNSATSNQDPFGFGGLGSSIGVASTKGSISGSQNLQDPFGFSGLGGIQPSTTASVRNGTSTGKLFGFTLLCSILSHLVSFRSCNLTFILVYLIHSCLLSF